MLSSVSSTSRHLFSCHNQFEIINKRMKVITILITLLICFNTANATDLETNIQDYQKALIKHGVTGSSIAGVFRGKEKLALSSVPSSIAGDRPVTEDTIFPIWSMSKPVTIVAMMILLDRGAYGIDEPVKKYIPYFDGLKYKSKTESGRLYSSEKDLLIRHLLSHKSGYGYYGGGRGEGVDFRYPWSNLDELMRHIAKMPLEFEPGSAYLYGINQLILGRIVEVLSGKNFYAFLKEEIFNPLGMNETKFHLTQGDRNRFQPLFRKAQDNLGSNGLSPDGGISRITEEFDELEYEVGSEKFLGGEGLVSTFNDYRKFCEMLLAGGLYGDKRIISPESFDLMTNTVTPPQISGGYNSGFGYAFSLFKLEEPLLDGTNSPIGIFGWSGYHNTHFWIDQKNGIYGLFMTRTTPFSWEIQKHMRAAVYQTLATP